MKFYRKRSRPGLSAAAVLLALLATSRAAAGYAQEDSRQRLITVTDEAGRTVRVPAQVHRIVTLAPDLTEIVYALGRQEKLAGVPDYSDYPLEARQKPRVGAPLNPSLEAIVALRPDVVLATRSINRRETVEALSDLGLPVYATDPRTVEGALESMRHVATVIGAQTQGQALTAALQERLEKIRGRLAQVPATPVFFVVWEDPLISIGPNTFLADALRQAGAESVVSSDQDWPRLSFEELLRLQPSSVILTEPGSPGTPPEQLSAIAAADLKGRTGWRELKAVKEGHVVVLPDAIERPGPRLIENIERLAAALHPEAMLEPTAARPAAKEAKELANP